MKHYRLLGFLLALAPAILWAQTEEVAVGGGTQPSPSAKPVDQILAVVDDEIILQSEADYQHYFLVNSGQKDDGTLYCQVLESLLTDKLLLAKAKLDSLVVSDDQIESELEYRLNAIILQYGDEATLEKELGKSVVEFRVDLRPKIKEQLLIEQMRAQILGNIDVSPRDVQQFFAQVPKDSLPNLPAQVEYAKILIKPKPSRDAKAAVKKQLQGILVQIQQGEISFEDAARKYSEDPGSKERGGYLGELGRRDVVPEFAQNAFSLKEGEISSVFETDFGYHIVRLHKRLGEKIVASHILIQPRINSGDETKAKSDIENLRAQIIAGKLQFGEAAREFSQDRETKDNGGVVQDRTTGNYRIPLDQLEGDVYLAADQLEEGEISQPLEVIVRDDNGQLVKAYLLIKLLKRYPPHKSSLDTDYATYLNAAKQVKQQEKLEKWFENAKEQVHIEIKTDRCQQALQRWY